jgi:DNA adenine methylase
MKHETKHGTAYMGRGKVRAAFIYYAGKGKLQHIMQPLIPDYKTYCEPFAGAASTLFHLERWVDKVEILNEINGNISNFYRVAKNPKLFEKLKVEVDGTLHSQVDFKRACKIYFSPNGHSKVMRAWAVWAGFNMAHFGDLHPGAAFRFGRNLTRCGMNKEAADIESSKKNLAHLAGRLKRVTILSIDGLDCIRKVDGPDTFFFIDPPYHESDMGHLEKTGWNKERFLELLEVLKTIKGKFLLTYNLVPELEDARSQRNWNKMDFEFNNPVGFNNSGKMGKRIVTRIEAFTWNYTIQRRLFD